MAESYWEQAARGAVPNAGMSSYVNPLAYSSPTTPFNTAAVPATATTPQAMKTGKPQGAVDLATELRNQYKAAYDTARKDNLARYDQGIKMHDDLYKRAFGYYDPKKRQQVNGYWDNFGANQKLAIDQAVKQNAAKTQAAAADRGIYNTSTALNQLGSAQMEGQRLLADVEAKRAEGRMNTDATLTQNKLDFVERRNDTYPDFNQLIALDKAVGSGTTEGLSGGGGYSDPYAAQVQGQSIQSQYGMPQMGFAYSAAPASNATPQENAMRQLSYQAKRLGFKSVQDMLAAQRKGPVQPAMPRGGRLPNSYEVPNDIRGQTLPIA